MKTTKVGVIGCGMISDYYFSAAKKFKILEIVACSDILPERAADKKEKYGVQNMTNEELLARKDIEIVLNLTPPQMHAKIALATLNAGKHAYSEKPFGADQEQAAQILALAKEKGLRVGCAPDTFLGAGQQTARKLVDDGWIGKPVCGTSILLGRGPSTWPHGPAFYDYGAGPMLDMGPYYLTTLVNILGPAKSVTAFTAKMSDFRRLGPEVAPQYQHLYQPFGLFPVNVTTHLTGAVEFQCGAIITVIASYECFRHGHHPIELYGTDGSIQIPDPNTFDGPVKIWRRGDKTRDWKEVPLTHSYCDPSRSIGVADMAYAIRSGRRHRANGELANHVLEILTSFDISSKLGTRVELKTTCERPEALPLGLQQGELPE